MATGGNFLPPSKPPKVPFEMTPMLQQYAAAINVKLSGLPSYGDSDSASSAVNNLLCSDVLNPTSTSAAVEPHSTSTVVDPPSTSAAVDSLSSNNSVSVVADHEDSVLLHSQINSSGVEEHQQTQQDIVSTPMTGNSSQFFLSKQQQQQRSSSKKRKAASSFTNDNNVKSTLLAGENTRRNELHAMEMQIKSKQLKSNDLDIAIKAKQLEVWEMLASKLAAAPVAANDIVAIASVVGNAMGRQQKSIDLTDAEVVYEEERSDAGAVNVDIGGLVHDNDQTEEGQQYIRSPSVFNEQWESESLNAASFLFHQSPFTRDRMYESPASTSHSSTPSPTDCEHTDPSFKPGKE